MRRVPGRETRIANTPDIGAGLYCGIENGAVAAAKLGAVPIRFDLEFLHGIDRRLDDVAGSRLQVGDVRVVINPIQHVVVLIRCGSVGAEPGGALVRRSGLGRRDAGGKQR